MYDTKEEARQKLVGTVVIYDNCPVYVDAAGGNKNHVWLQFRRLPLDRGPESDKRDISDPRWDFRNLGSRLGYIMMGVPSSEVWDSVYTSRVPIRASRQGLDKKTVKVLGVTSYPFAWEHILCQEGIVQTMQNLFPSSQEAFDKLVSSGNMIRSVPIGRRLAIMYDLVSPPVLLYRGDRVAYTDNGLKFKLAAHKQYLREELEDVGGLCIA